MFKKAAYLLTGLLVLTLTFGCARNPVGTETGYSLDQEEQTSNFNNDPYAYNSGNNNTTNQNQQTGYGTQDPYSQPVDVLTATISNKEFPGLWLWEKVSATIMVNNSSQAMASGVLNITFTHEGETVETQQQTVSLQAGESKQVQLKSTKHADDVTVTITPDSASSYSSGYSSGYGSSTNSSSSGYSSQYGQYGSY